MFWFKNAFEKKFISGKSWPTSPIASSIFSFTVHNFGLIVRVSEEISEAYLGPSMMEHFCENS